MADEELKRSINELVESVKDKGSVDKTGSDKEKKATSSDKSTIGPIVAASIKTAMGQGNADLIKLLKTELQNIVKGDDKKEDGHGSVGRSAAAAVMGGPMGSILNQMLVVLQSAEAVAAKAFEELRGRTAADVETIAIKHAQAGRPLSDDTIKNLRDRFHTSQTIALREHRRVEDIVGTGGFRQEKLGLAPYIRSIRNMVQDVGINIGETEERRMNAAKDPNYLKMLQREKDKKAKQVNDNHVYNGTEG